MASVTVFVDRAVQGDLPSVCVRTGAPAADRLPLRKPIGGLGWAWVLFVLGPPGWLILALVSVTGAGREVLEVRLPYSEAAFERRRSRNRKNLVAWGVVAVAVIAGLTGFIAQLLWAAIGVVALAVALVTHLSLAFGDVGVQLDGSRRWVTLTGVHDDFADALAREPRTHGTST